MSSTLKTIGAIALGLLFSYQANSIEPKNISKLVTTLKLNGERELSEYKDRTGINYKMSLEPASLKNATYLGTSMSYFDADNSNDKLSAAYVHLNNNNLCFEIMVDGGKHGALDGKVDKVFDMELSLENAKSMVEDFKVGDIEKYDRFLRNPKSIDQTKFDILADDAILCQENSIEPKKINSLKSVIQEFGSSANINYNGVDGTASTLELGSLMLENTSYADVKITYFDRDDGSDQISLTGVYQTSDGQIHADSFIDGGKYGPLDGNMDKTFSFEGGRMSYISMVLSLATGNLDKYKEYFRAPSTTDKNKYTTITDKILDN